MSKPKRRSLHLYEARLVGLTSGRRYLDHTVVFHDLREGERWIEESNASALKMIRWELVPR